MDYSSLDRKALQCLAKQNNIKANQSNSGLIEALKALDSTPVSFTQTLLPAPPLECFIKEPLEKDSASYENPFNVVREEAHTSLPVVTTAVLLPDTELKKSPMPSSLLRNRSLTPLQGIRGKTPLKQPVSALKPSVLMSGGSVDSFQFKPKPMPDFKKLHEQLSANKITDENKKQRTSVAHQVPLEILKPRASVKSTTGK